MENISILKWIQTWFYENCDGDWELEPPSPKRRGIPDSSLPATWAAPQALDRHPGGP
ncbi:MAG: hypothetical protein WAM28_07340 [Chlamydiales bacterium]